MMSPIWGDESEIQISDATKFLTSADNERKNSLVISLRLDLDDQIEGIKNLLPAHSDGDCIIKNEKDSLFSHVKEGVQIDKYPSSDMAKYYPSNKSFDSDSITFVAVLDMKDEEGLFESRYYRKTPVKFQPHGHD